MIYGTDAALVNRGFSFDEVTVTDLDLQIADGQSDLCSSCGDGNCDTDEDGCRCPEDCGTPPVAETGLCDDGSDNDCDGLVDCADAECASEPFCRCDNDGICEAGEDCAHCVNDCPGGPPGPDCGNGVCEPTEDCLSCASDCNGKQNGNPNNRYCCSGDGLGGGSNPVDCGDQRCTGGGNTCSSSPVPGFCCGQSGCETGEDSCSCDLDCGAPPLTEIPGLTCTDAVDNDCDGLVDCDDPTSCSGNPNDCPTCAVKNDPCSAGSDCCSGVCKKTGRCR